MNTSPFWDYVLEKGINTRRIGVSWYTLAASDAFGDGHAWAYDLTGDGSQYDSEFTMPVTGDAGYWFTGVGAKYEPEHY